MWKHSSSHITSDTQRKRLLNAQKKTVTYYTDPQRQNKQKMNRPGLGIWTLAMSYDLKGPIGAMGLIHRSLCCCSSYIGQSTCTSTAHRGASEFLSHDRSPEVMFQVPRNPHLWTHSQATKQLLAHGGYSSTANCQTEIFATFPVIFEICYNTTVSTFRLH